MAGIIVIFLSHWQKLLSHMDHIIEKISSSNHKIYFNDQMVRMIVNLGSDKWKTTTTTHAKSAV